MTRIFVIFAFILFAATAVTAADKTAYEGHFWNQNKDGIFKLQLTEDGIEGITVWGEKPMTDIHNPDPALKGRSLGGITFLWGFTYDAKKNRWEDGKVYEPDSGKTYDAKMSLEKGGKILKMRGYIGMALFGKTAKFERVQKDTLPAGLTGTPIE